MPTATFRVLHVLLVIRHRRRAVCRCAVATSPTAGWIAQQLREAFPFDSAPHFMIFDRGAVFSARVTATLRSMQMEPTRTAYRSPWQNGVAERLVATVRRELLDHVIVVNERHLRRLLDSFIGCEGFERLAMERRLDLSVENAAWRNRHLYADDVGELAEKRLAQAGFDIHTQRPAPPRRA